MGVAAETWKGYLFRGLSSVVEGLEAAGARTVGCFDIVTLFKKLVL
jgi:hypothetical protein